MPQDKEYLLKEQTAEATYQKKLTAGQNIVISPDNVISALGSTAPPTSVTVTPKTLSGENIADMTVNGTTYHLYSSYPRTMTGATTASAGQSGYVPTPYSTDKDYVLYGSGEWKDPHVPVITANPAGSTTTALNKLYLDGTIYGIAGGGGGSGSTVSITPTFADGVKIADYEIDGTSGVLKIPVKELTQTEYDALPSTKLTDNVVYYISGAKVLDPDYTYHTWGENDEIVVRVYHEGESDENIIWFFNGWNQTAIVMSFPTELEPYKPSNTEPILGANYPNGGTTQDGWIGFYDDSIRAWSQTTEYNVTGIKYGVVDINGESRQYIPYEDPYVWISSSIKKIIVNGTEYGNTGGGGSGAEVIPNPQDQPTDTLESIGIDGTVYELPGANKSIPLFKEGQWLNQDIIEITPYLATIENNKLHCQGLHCGIVVSNIISLSDAVYYSITIKVSSTNGFGFQIGQCVPTTNLDGIIGSGTDRITYNNESSFDSGELTVTTNNNTNGIFLGGYYQDVNTDYYIEEISLLKITVVKKEYT